MHRVNNKHRETIGALILSIIGVVSLVGIFGTLIYIKDTNLKREIDTNLKNVQSRELKSCVLDSNNYTSINGSFVLGVGSVHSKEVKDIYYYFYMRGQEGFVLRSINSDYVEIIPMDSGEPYIKGHFDKYGDLYEPIDLFGYDEEYKYSMTHYKMYIPSDYITETYDLDINNLVEN